MYWLHWPIVRSSILAITGSLSRYGPLYVFSAATIWLLSTNVKMIWRRRKRRIVRNSENSPKELRTSKGKNGGISAPVGTFLLWVIVIPVSLLAMGYYQDHAAPSRITTYELPEWDVVVTADFGDIAPFDYRLLLRQHDKKTGAIVKEYPQFTRFCKDDPEPEFSTGQVLTLLRFQVMANCWSLRKVRPDRIKR
jgi:hypothetical protein